jgi:DNA-directed RNA polymerase subunit E'/Rpb7
MDNNINEKELDINLYNEILLLENIFVSPDKFNNKINTHLEELLKNKIEQKCIAEGYVKKDTVQILKKSIGNLKGSQFNGYINYELKYKAQICSPKNGSIIKCKVKLVNNKLGVLGSNGPLTIIVAKQLHNNPELLDEINIDDVIEIKVIESKYSLNDKEIKIIAKLNTDIDISKNEDNIENDLNEIDNQDAQDNQEIINKQNIDNIELESLDGLSSEDDIDEEQDEEDIDEEDEQDIDEEDEKDDQDEQYEDENKENKSDSEDEDLDEMEETEMDNEDDFS